MCHTLCCVCVLTDICYDLTALSMYRTNQELPLSVKLRVERSVQANQFHRQRFQEIYLN